MKKFLIGLTLFSMIGTIGVVNAASNNCIVDEHLYAYNNAQIVNGATIQGGRWVLVKLRIQNAQVFGFSFGRTDMIGNIVWESCYPTSYRRTQPGLDGNEVCRQYQYTATLSGQGFSSFTVYF